MKSFSKKGKEKQSEAIAPAALPSEESTELAEAFSLAMAQAELRLTGIYGDISEEKCSEAVYGLLTLSNTAVDQENPLPIEFYVSSHGGQATEMFSVYDVMRAVREKVPIHTYGIGKVMSAGVLLLAAGTPGERRIGRNCRVMIHGVVAGQHGHIADIENEFSETKMTQKMYIKALADETDMTERYLKKLMERKTNVYLDAEEALNLGIADIIV